MAILAIGESAINAGPALARKRQNISAALTDHVGSDGTWASAWYDGLIIVGNGYVRPQELASEGIREW